MWTFDFRVAWLWFEMTENYWLDVKIQLAISQRILRDCLESELGIPKKVQEVASRKVSSSTD